MQQEQPDKIHMNKHLHFLSKKDPDIIGYNSKQYKQILIFFDTNISDATGHQTTAEVPTSPSVCFCTTLGKRSIQNSQKAKKNVERTSRRYRL